MCNIGTYSKGDVVKNQTICQEWFKASGSLEYTQEKSFNISNVISAGDGGIYVVGQNNANGSSNISKDFDNNSYSGSFDVTTFVSKIDKNGNMLWFKFMGTGNTVLEPTSIALIPGTSDTGIFIAGGDISNSSTPTDFAGTTVSSGGVYGGFVVGLQRIWIAKIDQDGNQQWLKFASSSDATIISGFSIAAYDDANVYAYFNYNGSLQDFSDTAQTTKTNLTTVVAKLDASNGNQSWLISSDNTRTKSISTQAEVQLKIITISSDGTNKYIYVIGKIEGTTSLTDYAGSTVTAGATYGGLGTSGNFFVAKINDSGTQLWFKVSSIGDIDGVLLTTILPNSDDGVYVSAFTDGTPGSFLDFANASITTTNNGGVGTQKNIIISKLNNSGVQQWYKTSGTDDATLTSKNIADIHRVSGSSDNGIYLYGSIRTASGLKDFNNDTISNGDTYGGFNYNSHCAYLTKINENGIQQWYKFMSAGVGTNGSPFNLGRMVVTSNDAITINGSIIIEALSYLDFKNDSVHNAVINTISAMFFTQFNSSGGQIIFKFYPNVHDNTDGLPVGLAAVDNSTFYLTFASDTRTSKDFEDNTLVAGSVYGGVTNVQSQPVVVKLTYNSRPLGIAYQDTNASNYTNIILNGILELNNGDNVGGIDKNNLIMNKLVYEDNCVANYNKSGYYTIGSLNKDCEYFVEIKRNSDTLDFTTNTSCDNIIYGVNTGKNLSTSNNNVLIGCDTGNSLTTGSNNILFGNLIDPGNVSNTFYVQNGITGIATGSNLRYVTTTGQIAPDSSSKKYKENIKNMPEHYSEKIYDLEPKQFNYKNDPNKIEQFGYIAEEVVNILPEIVPKDKNGNPVSVNYDRLVTLLVNEVKKLKKKNNTKFKVVEHNITNDGYLINKDDILPNMLIVLTNNMDNNNKIIVPSLLTSTSLVLEDGEGIQIKFSNKTNVDINIEYGNDIIETAPKKKNIILNYYKLSSMEFWDSL